MSPPLPGFSSLPEHEEVVVVARFRCRPGDEQATEERLLAHVRETHAEQGCRRDALHRVVNAPQVWVLVERWASKAAFRRHHKLPHMSDLPDLVSQLAEPPDVWFLDELGGPDSTKAFV